MSSSPPLSPEIIGWLTRSIGPGAAITAVRQLAGATSSTLYAIQCQHQGRTVDLVLRLFTNAEWLQEEPDVAPHEASNLQKVKAVGLPTPDLIAFDADGRSCGVPALLMTRLPGRIELRPAHFQDYLTRMAEVLIRLHTLGATGYPWQFTPYYDVNKLTPSGWSRIPDLWQKAIEIASGPWPDYVERFIHRDYHPSNLLWADHRVSGVIDWANACRGPAGIDVAWCRRNLASMYGVRAADAFLQAYQSLAGSDSQYHPFWDLLSILDGMADPPSIYPPWMLFGLRSLTTALLIERDEEFLASILARF